MVDNVWRDLIACLNNQIHREKPCFSSDEKELLYRARIHGLASMVAYALLEQGKKEYLKEIYPTMRLHQQQEEAFCAIKEAFAKECIDFIPLKGVVMKAYYPAPWMRTGCDLDLLIRRKDLARAVRVMASLGFSRTSEKSAHDIEFLRGRVQIELHFSLMETYFFPRLAPVLDKVWERALPVETSAVEYRLPDDLGYCFHMAHMVKHFVGGGCGIRPLIDLYYLNHTAPFDRAKRRTLLSEAGILDFARAVENLSDNWFFQTKKPVPEGMEEYILFGGTYGNLEQGVQVKKILHGGGAKRLTNRLFSSPAKMKEMYPKLQSTPALLPYYYVVRLSRAFTHRPAHHWREFRALWKSDPAARRYEKLLRALSLSEMKGAKHKPHE